MLERLSTRKTIFSAKVELVYCARDQNIYVRERMLSKWAKISRGFGSKVEWTAPMWSLLFFIPWISPPKGSWSSFRSSCPSGTWLSSPFESLKWQFWQCTDSSPDTAHQLGEEPTLHFAQAMSVANSWACGAFLAFWGRTSSLSINFSIMLM